MTAARNPLVGEPRPSPEPLELLEARRVERLTGADQAIHGDELDKLFLRHSLGIRRSPGNHHVSHVGGAVVHSDFHVGGELEVDHLL